MRRNSSKIKPLRCAARCSAIDSGRWIARSASVAVDEVVAVEERLVERVGEAARRALRERVRHQRAQLPGEHLGLARLRVDRDDHAGLLVGDAGPADHVDDRVRHLALAAVHVELAEERHLGADASCFSRHAWLKNVTLSSDVPSWTTTSTSALPLRVRRPWTVRTSAKTVASSPTASAAMSTCLRAVDPAARVVLQQVEHVVQPHVGEARLERGTDALQARERDLAQIPQRQRRIAGRHRCLPLLHADEVGVQRLAAVVELDLEVRERDFDVLADALGVLGRGVAADEHGDDLAVVVDERRRAARTPRRPASAVVATMPSRDERDPVALADLRRRRPTVSRTAWVTSPVRTRSRADVHRRLVLGESAFGSYSTSAASASGTLVVATTATCFSLSASTCLATATMFLLFGSTITQSAAHASTASRICAVDGFIDWPPATTCCTPRLVSRRRTPLADADRDDRGGDGRVSIRDTRRGRRRRRPRAPSAPLRPARSGR